MWNEWTRWSNCTKNCEGGTRKRTKVCENPEKNIENQKGEFCSPWADWNTTVGNGPGQVEIDVCNTDPCPCKSIYFRDGCLSNLIYNSTSNVICKVSFKYFI